MSLIDVLTGIGVIGIIIFIVLLIFIPAIAAFIVASLIASHFALSGIAWWAVVIVVFLIIMAIIGKLSS